MAPNSHRPCRGNNGPIVIVMTAVGRAGTLDSRSRVQLRYSYSLVLPPAFGLLARA